MAINGTASYWAPVTSGVTQGSVFEPILFDFKIYINNIDAGQNNFISKFADNTRNGNSINTDRGRVSLQEDLRKFSEWSNRLKMSFNVNKCHIFTSGCKKPRFIMR